jgi:hypothetical protein
MARETGLSSTDPPVSRWRPGAELRRDLLVLLAVAVSVQLVLPDRADWAAHILAGGAIVVLVDAALGARIGPWAVTLGAVVVLLLAIVADLTLTGPFDPGDVGFTLAGALVITGAGGGSSPGEAPAPGWDHNRRVAMAWGTAVLIVAVYYRYGIRRGP